MATVCLTFKTRCYSLDFFIPWIKPVDYHHVPYISTAHTHSMETHSMEKVPSMENYSINQTE